MPCGPRREGPSCSCAGLLEPAGEREGTGPALGARALLRNAGWGEVVSHFDLSAVADRLETGDRVRLAAGRHSGAKASLPPSRREARRALATPERCAPLRARWRAGRPPSGDARALAGAMEGGTPSLRRCAPPCGRDGGRDALPPEMPAPCGRDGGRDALPPEMRAPCGRDGGRDALPPEMRAPCGRDGGRDALPPEMPAPCGRDGGRDALPPEMRAPCGRDGGRDALPPEWRATCCASQK